MSQYNTGTAASEPPLVSALSPASRLGVETLKCYRSAWQLDLTLRPSSLGHVLKFANNAPSFSVTSKDAWMQEDRQRASRLYGVTLNRPKHFPVYTFVAQSLLRLLKDHDEYEDAVAALFDAVWTHDLAVAKQDVLVDVLLKASVFADEEEARAFLRRAASKEEKAALQQEARRLADDAGCFGMPWIVVTRKQDGKTARFFGPDRAEQIAAFIDEPYLGPRARGVSKVKL